MTFKHVRSILRGTRRLRICLGAIAIIAAHSAAAEADDDNAFHEIETKYIFGNFTIGSAPGIEGEKAFESETKADFGKRFGRYRAATTELEFEYTPTQFMQIEAGPTVSGYNIHDVPGLNDLNMAGVNGFESDFRFLMLERGASPFAVTLSVEPEFHRLDETSGAKVSNYGLETRLEGDAELRHGAFAKVVILPDEDPDDLEELRAAVYDEWNPEGPTEVDKVESIVIGLWRKRRFQRYLLRTLGESVAIGEAYERKDRAESARLVNVLEDIESGEITADNFSDKVPPSVAEMLIKKRPRADYGSDTAWLSAVSDVITLLLDHLMMIQGKMATFSYELAIETLDDREQSYNERKDAKITKDIKDLAQIKAMKAMGIGKPSAPAAKRALKEIESPTIQTVEGE